MKWLKVLTELQEICLLFFFMCCCFSNSINNTPESSNDFMILIICISSFQINKVNPFPALTAPFLLIFISNLYIAFVVELVTDPAKLCLAKGIAVFVSAFFTKLPNQEPKDPPDGIILDISALLGFISVDILLAKTFLVLVVCLVVRNNSCDNSSSSRFFLYNYNVVPVLFFAADFNLFNCVFVGLTLAS